MPRHLVTCAAAHDPVDGDATPWVHLHVEGGGPYWLDVEARADATLADVDRFLRRIWLDCCGHLSAFLVAGGRFAPRVQYPKNRRVMDVFGFPGNAARYEYDFGSTTELLVRAHGARTRHGNRTRVRLLARNEPPPLTCDTCGQPATEVCPFSHDEKLCFCGTHSQMHACGDARCHLPVVNSPRMGVCGYAG